MPDTAVHVASGKVREIYELDPDRLLLVASDRISTFDVVLPTEIPDKGRVLTGLSAFWFATDAGGLRATICSTSARTARSTECRRLEMLPIECVVRGYLAGLRLEGLPARRAGCAGHGSRTGCASRTCCPSRSSRRRRRRSRGTTRTSTRRPLRELVGEERFREVERLSLELYRVASGHAAERGILIADTKFEFGLDARRHARARRRGAHARLLALLAGRRVRAGPRAAVVRQAVRPRLLRDARLGQDRARARAARRRSSPARVQRYVEAFERLTGLAFDDYLADPERVLR